MVSIPNIEAGNLKNQRSLLKVIGLKTEFRLKEGRTLRAVDGIDITIKPSEIHGLVGESGCGKTVTSLSIVNLINPPGEFHLYFYRMNNLGEI